MAADHKEVGSYLRAAKQRPRSTFMEIACTVVSLINARAKNVPPRETTRSHAASVRLSIAATNETLFLQFQSVEKKKRKTNVEFISFDWVARTSPRECCPRLINAASIIIDAPISVANFEFCS